MSAMTLDLAIRRLTVQDIGSMHALLDLFGAAFEDEAAYGSARPTDAYLQRLLAAETFVALTALSEDRVVGGLAAYELVKFEQARSEFYVYDLAVAADRRREGIATALLTHLKHLAAARGAATVFVQAHAEDAPAVALYSTLGRRSDVVHFDIDAG
jgi:aminoglycoside 3-N-acetyltransferase I